MEKLEKTQKVSGSAHCTNFHSWKAAGLAHWKGDLNRISWCVAEQTLALHFICGQANVLAANLTRNHKQAKISLASCLALLSTAPYTITTWLQASRAMHK